MIENIPTGDPPEIFVETSVHVSRAKSPLLRKKIDESIDEFAAVGSSTYVKLEYGNVVLQIVTYLYNELRKRGSLEAVRYHVANELDVKYHAAYIKWSFNLLWRFAGKTDGTERLAHALEAMLLLGTKAVDSKVDAVLDGVGCIWAGQDSSRGWHRPSKCETRRPGCRIDQFFRENTGLFREIKSAIDATEERDLTTQLRGFQALIPEAEREPELLRVYENCRVLADAIIAVQSLQGERGYSAFFTQNKAESKVLCKALRQLLVYLPQAIEDPIERIDFRRTPTRKADQGGKDSS